MRSPWSVSLTFLTSSKSQTRPGLSFTLLTLASHPLWFWVPLCAFSNASLACPMPIRLPLEVEEIGIGLMLDSLCVTLPLLSESLTRVLEEPAFRSVVSAVRAETLAGRMDPCEVARWLTEDIALDIARPQTTRIAAPPTVNGTQLAGPEQDPARTVVHPDTQ